VDLAEATAGTELQGCEEAAVLESSLIDDLNERQKGYRLTQQLVNPATTLSALAEPRGKDLTTEWRMYPLDRVRVCPSAGCSRQCVGNQDCGRRLADCGETRRKFEDRT
jgi:hypothetical protein